MTANRRWGPAAQWREARQQALADRERLLNRYRPALPAEDPIATQPTPGSAIARAIGEWMQRIVDDGVLPRTYISLHTSEASPTLVTLADTRNAAWTNAEPVELASYWSAASGGILLGTGRPGPPTEPTMRDQYLAAMRSAGRSASLRTAVLGSWSDDPEPPPGDEPVWQRMRRQLADVDRWAPEAPGEEPGCDAWQYPKDRATPYRCQECWPGERHPWEPARCIASVVNPENWMCFAHCAVCDDAPRICDRHREPLESAILGQQAVDGARAALEQLRERGRAIGVTWGGEPSRGLMQTITTPSRFTPMRQRTGLPQYPFNHCCPDRRISATQRLDTTLQTRFECRSCHATWLVSDEMLIRMPEESFREYREYTRPRPTFGVYYGVDPILDNPNRTISGITTR